MTKSQSRVQQEPRTGEAEYFNLHASGCGYLSRVRWVDPGKRRGGRTGEQFLACAINAMRGDVANPNYTYFDLRVSGEEAIELIEQLKPSVDDDRKVFIAFKLGDFYAHSYERDARNSRGQKTGEKENTALIKGRLLLITHVKVDGEVVYQRDDDAGADAGDQRGGDRSDADPSAQPPEAADESAVPDADTAVRPIGRRGDVTQPMDRTRVRVYQAAA